ncbi:IS3 family transposase [Enhygromyxa salina]|uniref:IS3 family transposase n=1 Tax=Enhygromyxa salina TaxID=215803 RepID=UPI0011BA8F79|nr:IS3 family transposase [Enhygromyxa salina]
MSREIHVRFCGGVRGRFLCATRLRQGKLVASEAYELIHAEKANFPIKLMCRVLEVSRSGYYASLTRAPSNRAKENELLNQQITEIFDESRGTYGSPRVTEELEAQGFAVDRKRVARQMAKLGLSADLKPKFRKADAEPTNPAAPNVLERRFDVDEPDRVWVSDITYVWTIAGWVYLAVVIDLFSRRVVGWASADHMRADLVLDALSAALGSREPSQQGLLFHSDQGSQYKATRVRETLDDAGITCSMSRRGNCWDNAVAEAFFATLKREYVYRKIFLTHEDAMTSIAEWIEVFYNGQRRHSTIGYCSPVEYERDFYAANTASQAA